MRYVACIGAVAMLIVLGTAATIWTGLYPVGADSPHSVVVLEFLTLARERSIARASRDVSVPKLDLPEHLVAGAADYEAMCAGCHLSPTLSRTDLSLGMYPQPPDLTRVRSSVSRDSAEESRRRFWIIKHGIKASGMPAWGPTHDDERIWAMVALLDRLPELTPQQYRVLTASSHEATGHH